MGDNQNDTIPVPYYMHRELAERVDKMEASIQELDKKGAVTDEILKSVKEAFVQNTVVVSEIGKAVNSIEKTMITMQSEVKNWATNTKQIGEKVSQIEQKIEVSEEKAKVDFRLVWKNLVQSKIFWILGGIGFLTWLILQAIANIDLVSLLKLLGR